MGRYEPYATPVAELWIEIPDGWGACTGEVLVGVRFSTPEGEKDVLVANPVEGLHVVAKPLGTKKDKENWMCGRGEVFSATSGTLASVR